MLGCPRTTAGAPLGTDMSELQLGLKQRGSLAMTPALQQAIGFLALSNAELSTRLADLRLQDADLTTAGSEPGAWIGLARHVEAPAGRPRRLAWRDRAGLGGVETGTIAAAAPGLIAHVEAQLPLLVRAAEDRPVALAFLRALDPTGWLGAGLEEIADEAGCDPARAKAVLAQLQAAEPAGLFSRSLAECLSLQAEDRGLMTPAFAALLRNLPLLAEGRIDALAAACACPADEVAAMVRALRRMDPKPGAAFDQATGSEARAPDLILRRDGEGWLLELNADTTPALRLRPGDDPRSEAQRQARATAAALDRRNATVLTIAAEIVTRQDAHLRDTALPLAALTINDLARAAGVHRSTASRVTAAMVMAMPRRTVTLRALMSAAAPAARRTEDPPSVQAVLHRIGALIAAEDPRHPLSDAEIARLLLPEGAALARRTVAKYRTLAGIAPQSGRRKA